MNKRIILILILLFPFLLLRAQVPGYMGKRFSFNYSLYTMNALFNPNEFGNSGILSFNTLHHFNLDFVTGRKQTIGLSFEYSPTSFVYSKELDYETYNISDPSYTTTMRFQSNSTGKMDVYGIGFYTRLFFGGNIAPLGAYFKPEATLLLYDVHPGKPVNLDAQRGYLDPVFINNSPYKTFALSLEIGQNHIFFNRMFIDYGIRIGMLPFMIGHLDPEYTTATYLNEVAIRRLARQYLLNIKLGIGVLLF